jgi:hypothetical protein
MPSHFALGTYEAEYKTRETRPEKQDDFQTIHFYTFLSALGGLTAGVSGLPPSRYFRPARPLAANPLHAVLVRLFDLGENKPNGIVVWIVNSHNRRDNQAERNEKRKSGQ